MTVPLHDTARETADALDARATVGSFAAADVEKVRERAEKANRTPDLEWAADLVHSLADDVLSLVARLDARAIRCDQWPEVQPKQEEVYGFFLRDLLILANREPGYTHEVLAGSLLSRVRVWRRERADYLARLLEAEKERDDAQDYVAEIHGAESFEQLCESNARALAAEARLDVLQQERARADAVVDAARAFVATTSYFRQNKVCRPSFEALAVALLALAAAPADSGDKA